MKDKGEAIDAIQEKVVSHGVLIWCYFCYCSGIFGELELDADTWAMIAMVYIGGQTAIDFAKVWKG